MAHWLPKIGEDSLAGYTHTRAMGAPVQILETDMQALLQKTRGTHHCRPNDAIVVAQRYQTFIR